MITEINGEKWFIEKSFHQNYMSGHKIKHVLYEGQSEYQNIKVAETHSVGKLLLLDDKTMVSDIDEFVYHEVTSHLPYMVHPNVQNVLVIGGGDGGVLEGACADDLAFVVDGVEATAFGDEGCLLDEAACAQ